MLMWPHGRYRLVKLRLSSKNAKRPRPSRGLPQELLLGQGGEGLLLQSEQHTAYFSNFTLVPGFFEVFLGLKG